MRTTPGLTRGFYALDRPDEMEPSIYMDPVTLYPEQPGTRSGHYPPAGCVSCADHSRRPTASLGLANLQWELYFVGQSQTVAKLMGYLVAARSLKGIRESRIEKNLLR